MQPTGAGPWWYDWNGFNGWLFLKINHLGSGPVWDSLARAGTFAGDHRWYPFYALAALALALNRPRVLSPHAVLTFLFAYVIDWGLVAWLKPWFDFPRPPRALGLAAVHIIGPPEFLHSFPSGHTAFAFLIAASLATGSNWMFRFILGVLALWVGWSRMAMGDHFPADVLGGAVLGILSALIAAAILRLLRIKVAY